MKREALSVFDVEHKDDEEPVKPHRIQFASNTVKPQGLPQFAYVSSALTFDAIIYTAIIYAPNLTDALSHVALHWPDAQAREAEVGVSALPAASAFAGIQYGTSVVCAKKRWYQK